MPAQIPELDLSMKDMVNMSYQEIAYEVMKLFLTDFTEEELKKLASAVRMMRSLTPRRSHRWPR